MNRTNKIPEVKFIDSGPTSGFDHLCYELNGALVKDTLILNNDVWKGFIKKIELEPGLYLQFWDCNTAVPLLLIHEPAELSAAPSCNIVYSLSRGILSFKQEDSSADSFIQRTTNTFLTTNHTRADFELTPHSNFRALFISLSSAWMMEHFKYADDSITEFIQSVQTNKKPVHVFETSTKDEYLLINRISDIIKDQETNDLLIHSTILLLISMFFDKVFIHKQSHNEEKLAEYYGNLKKAEDAISRHLLGKLPSLKDISAIAEMNESSLKRYFRQLFGKNIYEYYLQKKMELAKRLLIEKNLNVNEVAAELGYEKASNFIDVFKKHFGYLPGNVRKKN